MCSSPARRLHITDKLQVRGVSSEEDLSQEFAEEGVVYKPKWNSSSLGTKTHVLLCSPCQGRGEIWLRGFDFCPLLIGHEQWVKTTLFGLWREEGTVELLDV